MSKTLLKKHLQTFTKEQLVEQILDLYDTIKPVKEFYNFSLQPDENSIFEKYKKIIVNEFFPKNYMNAKTRFSVAKQAIADFAVYKPSPDLVADLMMTLAELASKFTFDFGDMTEQYYTSTVTNFEKALKFIAKNNLLDNFKLRCETCLKYAEPCGYGFPDEMQEVYDEFYGS